MAPLLGKPMIVRQIERVRRARSLDGLVVATSEDSSDDELAQLCNDAHIPVHRGSLDDVLDRFVGASNDFPDAEWIVRLTGDCPLTEPLIIDKVVDLAMKNDADYAANDIRPTYPDGLDVEIMRREVLRTIATEPRTPAEREHVTLAICRAPERFKLFSVEQEKDLSHLRWTVDEPVDLELVSEIYQALYPKNPEFSYADILALLDRRPELAMLNRGIMRNEGLAKSLAREADGGTSK
jgi:spore coat polysaccharide biosynthesis protein SpsF